MVAYICLKNVFAHSYYYSCDNICDVEEESQAALQRLNVESNFNLKATDNGFPHKVKG
jgi:hypothetical protein